MKAPFSKRHRRQPGPARAGDLSSFALGALYEALMVDDEWALQRPNGFTWWAYRLAQHVEASPFEAPDGATGCRLRVWTDVVAGVPDPERAASFLGMANAFQSLSASRVDSAAATITDGFAAVVYEESVETMLPVIAAAAVLQNAAAHSHAHGLAEALGGSPAASEHPQSGERTEMDEMLNVPAEMATNAGAEASHFGGDLLRRLEPMAEQMGLLAFGGPQSFSAEVPCTGVATTADLLSEDGSSDRLGSALVQVATDQDHPQLGSGALVTMRLPFALASEDAAQAANDLNRLELVDPAPVSTFGAWCNDPGGGGVAFISFLPSSIARPGLLENFLIWDTVRAQWAAEALA